MYGLVGGDVCNNTLPLVPGGVPNHCLQEMKVAADVSYHGRLEMNLVCVLPGGKEERGREEGVDGTYRWVGYR